MEDGLWLRGCLDLRSAGTDKKARCEEKNLIHHHSKGAVLTINWTKLIKFGLLKNVRLTKKEFMDNYPLDQKMCVEPFVKVFEL